jgi:hypothetical protein
VFPPRPQPFRGRAAELRTLAGACRARPEQRLALVGPGGSGKSALACALGYALGAQYPGGREWFRVGAWDQRTLLDMLALRLGVPLGPVEAGGGRARRLQGVRDSFVARGRTFVVLDNHEDDRAMARLLDALDGLPVTWVLTARRCLLGGVSLFPVAAPLATTGRSPFPRVAALTKLLRWNPLALDISNAVVGARAATAAELGRWLIDQRVDAVSVIAHEDDLPEIRLLVSWLWPRVGADGRRMLAVLAHTQGDHMDARSLATLARAGRGARASLERLLRWHVVQQPLPGRFALHATVRYAVASRTTFDQRRAMRHYLALLERQPERLDLEQTHLFAAMDYAHATGDLGLALRLDRLLEKVGVG